MKLAEHAVVFKRGVAARAYQRSLRLLPVPRLRHELRVALGASLEAQEVVVAAAGATGILAADAGARLVDRAAAGLPAQEPAGGPVDRIRRLAEDDFPLILSG